MAAFLWVTEMPYLIDAIYQAMIRNDPALLHNAASDLIYSVKWRIV